VRFIVYGAGAIGGLAGALMAEAGADVTLIARGPHAEAMSARGLVIASADGERTVAVDVVTAPEDARVSAGDAVLLAVKSHQTAGALDALRWCAPPETSIACLQNGVDNERAALRLFRAVYAVCVMCPAGHLEPGVVQQDSVPVPGTLDIGRYPTGLDETAGRIAAGFRAAGFQSVERPDVMRWKYRKLLMNLGNAVSALCRSPGTRALTEAAQAEGDACLAAAGIAVASKAEDLERRGDVVRIREIPGRPRGGGSSWQSLQRATGDIESDFLNGEIGLLGRLHGIATPVNDLLQQMATRAARDGVRPGSYTGAEILARATT
jgi:2-dehydropantoate 2-reductase